MTWVVEIPAPCGWISSNDRVPWQMRAGQIKQWRYAAGWWAKHAKVPRLDRAEVSVEVVFQDSRRRDPHNYMPTVKAAIDGLVDVGVLPDDDSTHLTVTKIDLAVDRTKRRGELRLQITPIEVSDAA